MNVQCFIPDWPGPKQHAADIFRQVVALAPTTILDEPTDYFNAQWEKARQKFLRNNGDKDILLWIMADITLPENFNSLFTEMKRVMERGDIGWYAPNVEWTSFIYDKKDLRCVEGEIFEVPNTDSLCFAIRGDVLRKMPFINPQLCYMWGMDFTAFATARMMGLKTVRDYKFKVLHPNSTGYIIDQASVGMKYLFESYPSDFRVEVQKLIDEANRLKRLPK